LREPGTEDDDDHGAGIGDATALQDLQLDVVDAYAGDCRPGDRQNEQHDDRALSPDDRHDDDQKAGKQRQTCKRSHIPSPSILPVLSDKADLAPNRPSLMQILGATTCSGYTEVALDS
jgi:hypothetical protein